MDTGFRAHVDEEVRRADDLRVMLHHDNGVADVAEAFENGNKAVGIPGMQADGRLVQDVHGPDQRTAERRHEVHTLAFTAGERVHRAAQGQIAEADILDAVQPENDLLDAFPGNAALIFRQLHTVEEREQFVDGHRQEFVDVLPAHADVQRLLPEPAAAAGVAGGPAGIPAEHVFVLDLVAVLVHPFEELVDAHDGALVHHATALGGPEGPLLLLRELAVRDEDRDIVLFGILDHEVLEPAHLVAAPAGHGSVVDALGLVRHDEVLADADDLSQATAHGARPQRAVEAEQVLVRLAERHPVEFKPGTERLPLPVQHDGHVSFPLVERRLHGRQEPCTQVLVILLVISTERSEWRNLFRLRTVDQQMQILGVVPVQLHHVLDPEDLLGVQVEEAAVAFLLELEHEFDLVLAVFPADVGKDVHGMGLAVEDVAEDVLDGMGLHFQPAHGRIGPADTGVQEPQEVVDFRGSGDGGTGVPDVHLLLDGDGRRDALDHLHIGLGHTAQELAGVGRQALGEAALALGEQRIERQGRLPTPGNARDHHEPVPRNLHCYVLEVIDLRPSYDDIPFCWHVQKISQQSYGIFM